MALDKVVDSAELDASLQVIAEAIRAKGGTSEALEFPAGFVSAVEAITAGSGESGGSVESGELTATAATYYKFTIPVSSKKSCLVVRPKDFEGTQISPPVSSRVYFVYAEEETGIIETVLTQNYNAGTGLNTGGSYWYNHSVGSANAGATFYDDSIYVKIAYSPFQIGEYLWYAW